MCHRSVQQLPHPGSSIAVHSLTLSQNSTCLRESYQLLFPCLLKCPDCRDACVPKVSLRDLGVVRERRRRGKVCNANSIKGPLPSAPTSWCGVRNPLPSRPTTLLTSPSYWIRPCHTSFWRESSFDLLLLHFVPLFFSLFFCAHHDSNYNVYASGSGT